MRGFDDVAQLVAHPAWALMTVGCPALPAADFDYYGAFFRCLGALGDELDVVDHLGFSYSLFVSVPPWWRGLL